jgi:hypothetical protein
MRDDFNSAFEDAGIEDDGELKNEIIMPEDDVTEDEAPQAEPAAEEAPAAEAPAAEGGEVEPPLDAGEGAAAPTDAEAAPATEDVKAPIGFSPEAREAWKDVPKTVQDQIHKREQEIAQAMQGTSEARKTHQYIEQLAQSYAPIMAAEGASSPAEAIQGLFQTVSELRMGSPAQKAQKMAQLINHYGVDIGSLDSALAGEQPVDPQQHQFSQIIDEKLAPINQVMEQLNQLQAGKQQQSQVAAAAEITQFGQQAEFLGDVRNDMADLIDMAASRGYDMPLQEAYDKACALNPQIQAVLNQRKSAAELQAGQNSLAAKQAAGSSVVGRPAGSGGGTQGMSLHDTLAAAWDNQEHG